MTDAFLSYLFGGLWVGLPPAALVLIFWYWMRSAPRIAEPVWRGYSAIGATTLAGISVMLWVFSFVWARKIGGFGYYDPVLMRFYRWGSVMAGALVGSLPLVILYAFFVEHYVSAMTGAVKE